MVFFKALHEPHWYLLVQCHTPGISGLVFSTALMRNKIKSKTLSEVKSRLADVTLEVIAVLGWDDSLSITQITLQRKSSFIFQVEKHWQMADLGAGHVLCKV